VSTNRDSQRRVFKFLLEKYNTQELFTKDGLSKSAGWDPKKQTFRTYWSKQFRPLLIEVGDKYRVSQVFKRYGTWEKFRDNILTQNRALPSGYQPSGYEDVAVFEFFMPLRNEEYLRAALDSLFYRDFIMSKLKSFGIEKLAGNFPKKESEDEHAYFDRLCDYISEKFIGYSINHVSGRYRAAKLKTKREAFESACNGEPYLVDETTAIVRFIIPCGKPIENLFFRELAGDSFTGQTRELNKELKQLRWFFYHLFVESIVEVVNGEDEIWLLESGVCNQLHIWRRVRSTK